MDTGLVTHLGPATCAHTFCNFKNSIYLSNKTFKIKNFVAFITKYIYQPVSYHQQYDGYFTLLWNEKLGESLLSSTYLFHYLCCTQCPAQSASSKSPAAGVSGSGFYQHIVIIVWRQKDPPKGQPDAEAFIIPCA